MLPRERVESIIRHREADRIPMSFGGAGATSILECPPDGCVYSRLCNFVGIKDFAKPITGHVFDVVSNIDERVMQRLNSDFRRIDCNPPDVLMHPDGTKTILGIFCGLRVKKTGYYSDIFEFPLRDFTRPDQIRDYQYWPTSRDFQNLAIGKMNEARKLREETGYYVVADALLAFPFLMYALLSGYDKWFLDMKLNTDYYFALCDRLLEVGFQIVDAFVSEIGPYIDMITTFDDMGTQSSLFCSRDDYLNLVQPFEKQLIAHIKKYTDARIYRHSCGSVYEVVPDFIDMGIDVLNPVQPLAKNMEPWRLKKEFGMDLTFCGGIDIQDLLARRTTTEVVAGVKRIIQTYGPGGGYILGPSHNIEPDTPPENIVAMYDTGLAFGNYPIAAEHSI